MGDRSKISMLTLKLSDEQMQALGISSQEEALQILTSAKKSKDDVAAIQTQFSGITKGLTDSLTALVPRIDALEKSKLDADAILKQAKEAAAQVAAQETSAAIARSGSVTPLNSGAPPREEKPQPSAKTFQSVVIEKIGAGVTKAQAVVKAIAEQPALYKEYLKTGGAI